MVTPSDFTGDSIHEASAKAMEVEHSKEIIVFQRTKKRRQQQILRNKAAAANAIQRETTRRQQTVEHYTLRSSPTIATTSETTTTTLPSPSIRTTLVSSEVERLLEASSKKEKKTDTKVPLSVELIQAILPLPDSTLFFRQNIPISLSFGLTPYIPLLTFNSAKFILLTILATPSPPEEIPVITSSQVIADSLREDTGSSPILCPPSLSNFSPSCLDLLVSRTMETARDISSSSPIPMQPSLPSTRALSAPPMSMEEMDIFEARLASLFDMPSTTPTASNETKPLCCKVIEQSNIAISSHLSQAAATIDFYVNICHVAKAAEEKLLKDQEFVSHIHAEVSELKE
ncbi:uncharacterized protein LOC114306577 [Camellia sinensis]|uniref:uncharacterized protein LOC114306577 n=1 Tax=Camellia sinensis TaxID=4442 RepID=UPI0010360A06|nr:uncharacterized protein LOC114306577 [Camellia sinensis]